MPAAPVISIVDDDAQARDGIRELIEALGYQTVTFKSAQDFLRSGIVANTSCLITDVQMPGLNGLELQETLRSQGYDTPVILVTAYPTDNHRTRALDSGAVGFLRCRYGTQFELCPAGGRCDPPWRVEPRQRNELHRPR